MNKIIYRYLFKKCTKNIIKQHKCKCNILNSENKICHLMRYIYNIITDYYIELSSLDDFNDNISYNTNCYYYNDNFDICISIEKRLFIIVSYFKQHGGLIYNLYHDIYIFRQPLLNYQRRFIRYDNIIKYF